jgi:Fe2+ transport system protein FeoA
VKLSQAEINTRWRIKAISNLNLEIKLLELGFAKNTEVALLRKAPAGGPLTIENQRVQIMLRKEDAQQIELAELS